MGIPNDRLDQIADQLLDAVEPLIKRACRKQSEDLREEIEALRRDVQTLRKSMASNGGAPRLDWSNDD